MTVSILQLRSWQNHISFGRKRIVGQHLPSHQPLTNWIFLSVVLGYPSVPSFENYIIQDPKAFYVLTGIGFDRSGQESGEGFGETLYQVGALGQWNFNGRRQK